LHLHLPIQLLCSYNTTVAEEVVAEAAVAVASAFAVAAAFADAETYHRNKAEYKTANVIPNGSFVKMVLAATSNGNNSDDDNGNDNSDDPKVAAVLLALLERSSTPHNRLAASAEIQKIINPFALV